MSDQTAGFIARWGPEGIVEEARFRKELEALLLAAEWRGAERMREEISNLLKARAEIMQNPAPMCDADEHAALAGRAFMLRALSRWALTVPLETEGKQNG